MIRADDGRVLMASANALHFAAKKRAYRSTRASTLLIFKLNRKSEFKNYERLVALVNTASLPEILMDFALRSS